MNDVNGRSSNAFGESSIHETQTAEETTGDPQFSMNAPVQPQGRRRGKKRVFGISHNKPAGGLLPDDYENRYPEDEFGEEMGPTARVWRVYLDEAEFNDRDMVEGWRDGIDVLLVFAGLFSAVVSTFVVQTSEKLDVDYSKVSASLLTELINMQRAIHAGLPLDQVKSSRLNVESTAQAETIDVWVNALWFTSLSFSLITALGSVVIKQWISHYVSLPSGTPHERVRLHQFRYMGIQRWSVPVIIGVLPVLMHIALFLFFGGLVAFLSALKKPIAWTIGIIAGLAYALYVTTSILPLRDPQCPYRTPLIIYMHALASTIVSHTHRRVMFVLHRALPWASLRLLSNHVKENKFFVWCRERLEAGVPYYALTPLKDAEIWAAASTGTSIDLDAIQWLFNFSSNPSVRSIALQALSGIRHDSQHDALVKTPLEDELNNALESRLISAVNRYWKASGPLVEDFASSEHFSELERLLRAAMLVFKNHVFMSQLSVQLITSLLSSRESLEIDEKRLLAYSAYAFAACDDGSVSRYALPDPKLVGLVRTLFQSSEFWQHPAAQHPLVWRRFFTLLTNRYTHILYRNTSIGGFLNANYALGPLLDTMFLSELSDPDQIADDHQEVVQSIVHLAYKTFRNGLPSTIETRSLEGIHVEGLKLQVENGFSLHLQFWVIAMDWIISCCNQEDSGRTCNALANHLRRLSIYCRNHHPSLNPVPQADLVNILDVLDDLYCQPFFRNHSWDASSYQEFFQLYFNLESHHDTGRILIDPLLQLIPARITNQHLVKGLFECLCLAMEDLASKSKQSYGNRLAGALVTVVNNIVDCLRKLDKEKNYGALGVVFKVLDDSRWLTNVLEIVGRMIDESPTRRRWVSIQPLIQVFLEMTYSYLQNQSLPTTLRMNVTKFNHQIKQERSLAVICEMLICISIPYPFPVGNVEMPLPEAEILLRLARRDRHDNTPWLGYLSEMTTTFRWIHDQSLQPASSLWREWDYEQYKRVADFIDCLKANLGIATDLEEYKIPRFDEEFITQQLALARTRVRDAIPPNNNQNTRNRWWWTLGGLGRLLYNSKKNSDANTLVSGDEKEQVKNGSLV